MGTFCSRLDSSEMYEDGGRFVIRLIGATDIPKADVTSESDPYVKAYLVESGSKSKPFKTSFKLDNPNPIWNHYHDFRISYRVSAALRIEVWDSDFSSPDDLIGDVNIPLEELKDESVKTIPLNYRIGSKATNPNFSITLQRVYIDAPAPMKKIIYLLRHGESKWNEAQADKNYLGLVDMDHPLSKEGIDQATNFNNCWKAAKANGFVGAGANGNSADRRGSATKRVTFSLPEGEDKTTTAELTASAREIAEKQTPVPKPINYEELMLQCDHIYVSPLTRAIQTSLICLENHPVMNSQGIVLYSSIRETKKTVGGLDCCGVAFGDDIKKRVQTELANLTNPTRSEQWCRPSFDINDCNMPWWTGKVNSESKQQIESRIQEFVNFIQYNGSNSSIYVGHSMFFREFCSRLVGPVLYRKNAELAGNLSKYKLQNCTMVGLTICFPQHPTGQSLQSYAYIEDACVLFGGGFDTKETKGVDGSSSIDESDDHNRA